MAISNQSTVKELLSVTGNQLSEGIPNAIPVLNANPKDYRVAKVLASSNPVTTGAVTVYTASATKDTYISGVILSSVKNATADNASTKISLTGVVDAQTVDLASIALLTLTAQSESIVYSFYPAIKIDKGSVISLSGTFTLGAWIRFAQVTGYEVEASEK